MQRVRLYCAFLKMAPMNNNFNNFAVMSRTVNLILILTFSFLVVVYAALLRTAPGETIQIHFDAPIWIALQCALAQWLTLIVYRRYASLNPPANWAIKHYLLVFFGSNLLVGLTNNALFLPIELAAGIQHIDWYHVLISTLTFMALHTLVGGATLCFKAIENVQTHKLAVQALEKENLSHQVKLLQQQLDPHFLFNNLNVLSALMHTDTDEAEEYLESFCTIYRYVLESQTQQVTTVAKELEFATLYMSLLEKRFAGAYQLHIHCKDAGWLQHKTLACTLQIALENAIKHNQGDSKTPLIIDVVVNESELCIENNRRAKVTPVHSTGLGLANLRARSLGLLGQEVGISVTCDQFRLCIPTIKT